MSTSRKAEASIEFMVFFGIILVFFVFFIGIIGVDNNDISESTVYANAGSILNTVVNEINTASRMQGYYRVFDIPIKLSSGKLYNVTYNNTFRTVTVEWDKNMTTGIKKSVIGNIMTNNVTGSISAGSNRIENHDGRVSINEG
ncbi:MAG: hypothetical protein V1678_04565 [Candidatus Aenigmatarchaeota archaeon]